MITPLLLGALAMANPDPQAVDGSGDFAAALYQQVADGGDPNVILSPTSARVALLMVWAGADGKTRADMARALHLDGDDQAVLDQYAAWVKASQTPDDAPYELAIANQLWGNDKIVFEQPYLDLTKSVFDAPMQRLDFADAAGAVDRINQWCSDKTRERIPSILEQSDVGPATSLVLTNAVYFLGTWKQQFDPDQTRPQRFTRADGTTVDAPLMYRQGTTQFAETGQAKVVRLPYDGDRLWFVGVLPKEGHDLSVVEKKLDGKRLTQLATSTRTTEDVQVWLPKFELRARYKLNDPLIALGMGSAFGNGADFSRISTTPTAIDKVLQKTFLKVDEQGTEAAAVTAVVMRVTSAGPPKPPPPRWRADRPFLFYLWDEKTEEVLFLGHIGDPTE